MKSRLILCSGWRGVQAHLLHRLAAETSRSELPLRHILVLVPTAAAGHLVRTMLEQRLLQHRGAVVLPGVSTMAALLRKMVERSLGKITLADPLLREALLDQALGEAADSGIRPPFAHRVGLAPKVLAFREQLLLSGHRFEDFVSEAVTEFDDPADVGAERMAAQTRFLAEGLRRYEDKLKARGLLDGATLRPALLEALRQGMDLLPYRRLIALGTDALTPADLSFLTAAPGLDSIEIAIPEGMAENSRVRALRGSAALEVEWRQSPFKRSRLLVPKDSGDLALTARDREEVLTEVARLLKALALAGDLPPLERIVVGVAAPLPYLYLAKKALGQAGIPYQLQDDFPLAGEPYLAAVDLALDFVELEGRRSAALGLLRSPFFRFTAVGPAAVASLDRLLVKLHEPGGTRAWRRLLRLWRREPEQPALPGFDELEKTESVLPALQALVEAGEHLAPLGDPASPATVKAASLRSFLQTFGRPLATLGDTERHGRARGAFLAILERMSEAAREVGDPPIAFAAFRETLHRAIESHTFSVRSGRGGVQIVDARSAGYGSFDLVVLVGLNEGEWPAGAERNIFYPQWLLRQFGWPADSESLAEERAAFSELLRLSEDRVLLFRHQLEADIPTVPSVFLEEARGGSGLSEEEIVKEEIDRLVISRVEELRGRLLPPDARFQRQRQPGQVGTRLPDPVPISATAFELYLKCPFKYFSKHVLGIAEEEDFEEGFTPLEWGRRLHDILKAGFDRWDNRGERPRPITEENYEEALALFKEVALEKLGAEGTAVELARLFGSAGQMGEIEWMLRQEIARGALRKRLPEYPFDGTYLLPTGPRQTDRWSIRIRGRVDRVDVDSQGMLHLFDYKSGKAPETRISLQIPLYALCLEQELSAKVAEAAYLSFRSRKARPARPQDFERAADQTRAVFEEIRQGHFPPRPYQDFLCSTCGYVGLCRKEIRETDAGEEERQ